MYNKSISVLDRIISALSYLSAGWIGVIYFIVLYFGKKRSSRFLRFNVIQAILITLLYVVAAMSLNIIMGILSHVPLIKILIAYIDFVFNRPLIADYSLIQTFLLILVLYLVILSLLGLYPRIYKISDIIDNSVG